jgi:hypothetical protein
MRTTIFDWLVADFSVFGLRIQDWMPAFVIFWQSCYFLPG